MALPVVVGEGTWTSNGSSNIDDINDPFTEVSDLEFGIETYVWTVTNGICPAVVDSMTIEVRPIQETNGFSPNGDGINDLFEIKGLENIGSNELVVFNNWGDVVFEAKNYKNDWDGTSLTGKTLPSDTYYFILKIPSLGDYSGYLILKR